MKLLAELPSIPMKAAMMAASQELVWMSESEFHDQQPPRPGMCCVCSLLAHVEAPAALGSLTHMHTCANTCTHVLTHARTWHSHR